MEKELSAQSTLYMWLRWLQRLSCIDLAGCSELGVPGTMRSFGTMSKKKVVKGAKVSYRTRQFVRSEKNKVTFLRLLVLSSQRIYFFFRCVDARLSSDTLD
jgi:hypothetical protein